MLDFKQLSITTGLSPKVLRYLNREGAISDDFTDDQLYFLFTLKTLWGKAEFIKLQAANFNTTKRARLVFSAGLNKIESYVIHRWLGHYADNEDGFYLSVKQVCNETIEYLHLPISMHAYVTATVLKMRKKARNLVYRNDNIVEAAQALVANKRYSAKKRVELQRASNIPKKQKLTQNDIFGY